MAIIKNGYLSRILFIGLLISGGLFFYRILVKDIREKMRTELQQEIKKLVDIGLEKSAADSKKLPKQEQGHALDAPSNNNQRITKLKIEDNVDADLSQDIEVAFKNASLRSSIIDEPKSEPEATPTSTEINDESAISAGKSKDKAIQETLQEKGGMLLGKGKLRMELGFATAHFSSNRINIQGFSILPVIVIGNISTETVKRDIFIQTTSLKYGIWNNLQGEAKVPFRYEFDRVSDNLGAEYTRNAGGIGDIEFALSRQIAYEKGAIPDLVLSIGTKTRTGRSSYTSPISLGTGHWAIKSALIAAKSSDPSLVFGSLSYIYNLARNINNYGKVKPGDTIAYSLGSAISLSYQTAISFQFEHSITAKSRKDNNPVNGSFLNSASLKFGFNWALSENFTTDVSISHGLTTDAPDYVVEIRFPVVF